VGMRNSEIGRQNNKVSGIVRRAESMGQRAYRSADGRRNGFIIGGWMEGSS